MKKIVTIVLALTMILTSSVYAFAAETKATSEDEILNTWENDPSKYSTAFPSTTTTPCLTMW